MFQRKKQNQLKKQKKSSSHEPSGALTFLEHLHELRKRLFWVVLVLVVTSAIGLQSKDQLISAVMAPLHGQKLIYLTPGGGFSFIFTLSIYFGLLLSIPVMVYHLYRFVQPLLGKTSRKLMAAFIILSAVLAAAGAMFGYFVTIPAALNFLSNFAGDAVIPSLTAESYLNFVVTYVVGLALLFQLPLLLFIFDHISPFQKGTLSGTQDKVIIAATILAALITPTPDAYNMAIVAIPIIGVYEIGVVAVWVHHRTRRKSGRTVATRQKKSMADPELTIADEPLTAIIEELAEASVATPKLQPAVATSTASSASSSPTPAPAPTPVQNQPARIRTMDGFTPARRHLAVPQRTVTKQPVQQPSKPPARPVRPHRSIDGFF